MKKVSHLAAFAALALASAPAAAAPKPVELTAAELSTAQNHVYPVPPSAAFGAVLSTLQTMGYVDINASKDAGTISAITDAKAKTIYNIFWGFGKKKYTQKASVLIEDYGTGGSMVRLNLMVTETKARGIFGTSFSDGKMVRYGEPYAGFFQTLDAEVARRAPGAIQPVATTVISAPAAH